MIESSGVIVRRRRSKAEAEGLVFEFEQSGVGRHVFCSQHGLSIASLDKYRRRFGSLKLRDRRSASASNRILPVELVNSTASTSEGHSSFRVERANGRRIEVAPGFDASTLERLVAVLDRT